jgi:hypothetical protein
VAENRNKKLRKKKEEKHKLAVISSRDGILILKINQEQQG